MSYAPLATHTHYSLHRAITKPKALAKACAGQGIASMAMTDYGNIGCAVDFVTAMKEVCACGHRKDEHGEGSGCNSKGCECSKYSNKPIKPILGCNFALTRHDASIHSKENGRPYAQCIVLAKNLNGWRRLIAAVSRSSSKDYQQDGPRINLEDFRDFAEGGDLIAISGFMGSDIADSMFTSPKEAYSRMSVDAVRGFIDKANWKANAEKLIEQYVSIFGKGNFFLGTQVFNPGVLPVTEGLAKSMRAFGQSMGVECVALNNTHYLKPEHAQDQRVVLCAGMKTTFKGVERGRARVEPDTTIETFFERGGHCHLPTEEEMLRHHTREELDCSLRIAEMCEDYTILSQPKLPKFPCPAGTDPESYLRSLCERGWSDKIEGRDLPEPIGVYRDRLEMELGVINGAGLPSYFLIVQDFMNYGRDRGWILGPGRGSGAGCIVSWLTGITSIDPIEYGLIFERFYNAGRNAPGRISLPDIDCDVPKYKRAEVYAYFQKQYGEAYVAQIATFSSMQGRSALTAVLAAHEVNFDLVKRITKILPDKARISEELEEMRQQGEEPSIISYALDVFRDDLAEWVVEEEDGSLSGPYSKYFDQARRLEGVKTHVGRHAAGVLIGAEPLAGFCPLKWDNAEKANLAAMEYPALEAMGGCKIDVLAVVFLDKAQAVRSQARRGRIYDDTLAA